MNNLLLNEIFGLDKASEIISYSRRTLSIIILTWVSFGPFSTFYSEEELLLFSPTGINFLIPDIGASGLFLIKLIVVFSSLGMLFHRTAFISTWICAISFTTLNGYVSGFNSTFNYNTHINYFLFVIIFASRPYKKEGSGKAPKYGEEKDSAIVFFMRLHIAGIYFQAGISKLIYGGLDWGFHTPYVHIVLYGSKPAMWLANFPTLIGIIGSMVIILELILPFLFMNSQTRELAALTAITMHLAFYIFLGISFWHLWLLYPALFLRNGKFERRLK